VTGEDTPTAPDPPFGVLISACWLAIYDAQIMLFCADLRVSEIQGLGLASNKAAVPAAPVPARALPAYCGFVLRPSWRRIFPGALLGDRVHEFPPPNA
jgi:hypothetical protein